MKLTKTLALLLAVMMTLTLCTACGDKEPEDTDKTDVTDTSDVTDDPDVTDVYADKDYGFQQEMPQKGDTVAIMHTNMGDICIRFFPEAAPKAVENFLTHAKNGYYDGVIFHRVMKDFMIQGGDPKGTGSGGESIWGGSFEDEFSDKLFNIRGSLSMANGGANTNGSQFFINQKQPDGKTGAELKKASGYDYEALLQQCEAQYPQYVAYYGEAFQAEYPDAKTFAKAVTVWIPDEVWDLYAKEGGNMSLDNKHTVFGHVYKGMDVVDAIANVEVDATDPNSPKPVKDVIIESIDVIEYK